MKPWDFSSLDDQDLFQRRAELTRTLRTVSSELSSINHEIKRRDLTEPQDGGSLTKRQPWGPGWIQMNPRNVTLKSPESEGETIRTHRYWFYHWWEDGKRKRKYIGTDASLEKWKAARTTDEEIEKWKAGEA